MTNTPQQQPPGWYYAEGDPPGTQRYWDGAQWQGDPQAIASTAPSAGGAMGAPQSAETGQRLIAFLIDWVAYIAISIVFAILGGILGAASDTVGSLVSLLGNLAMFIFWVYNSVYLVGTTGQSIGKKQQGIKVLNDSGEIVGMGMAAARSIVQFILWSLCFIPGLIDSLMILGSDGRRFSDKLLSMGVYKE